MSTTTTTKLAEINVQAFIAVKNAFDECAPEVQSVVSDMLAIYNDSESSPREKQLAINTVIEALFPACAADILEFERVLSRSDDAKQRTAEMQEEEAVFAERVREIMDEQNITQEQLAQRLEISQPAVANLLNRNCRPQMRTVTRIANALNVAPESIWPAVSQAE